MLTRVLARRVTALQTSDSVSGEELIDDCIDRMTKEESVEEKEEFVIA